MTTLLVFPDWWLKNDSNFHVVYFKFNDSWLHSVSFLESLYFCFEFYPVPTFFPYHLISSENFRTTPPFCSLSLINLIHSASSICSTLLHQVTSAGPDRTTSSSLSRLFRCSQSVSECWESLCQGYLTILTSAWSSTSDHPPFWKSSIYWWTTPMFYQSIFSNEATDWHFSNIIISRTNATVIRSGLYQVRVHRKYDRESCGEKGCEMPLWFTSLDRTSTKLNKHSHHNFLSIPRAWLQKTQIETNNTAINNQYNVWK